jgi:glycosyltransferase involved in cell wall biosynthesis
MYSSVEEAVEKIIALLSDEELQADIRRRLFDHSQQFSIENFRKGLKKAVDEFFEGSI